MKTSGFVIAIVCCMVLLTLTGCADSSQQGKFTEEEMAMIPLANKYNLPEASGGYTLKIYTETITVDEVLQYSEKALRPFAEKTNRKIFEGESLGYIRETIRGKTVDILLYEEARKQAPENIDEMLEKGVETETARFVSGFNNNYALAEKAIKDMGMDWKRFREYQKKLILTQSYISSTLKDEKRFSRKELMDYYNRVRDKQFTQIGLIEFSLIDIQPEKLKTEQIADGETNTTAASRIAKEVMDKLNAGEDFAVLAETYSHTMTSSGGKWTPHTIGSGSLPKPYDQLEAVAIPMSPGDIKGPIDTDGHIFILKLERIQHGKITPFSEVKKQIQQQLLFEYRNKQYQELVEKLITTADVVRLEDFAKFCTTEAYNRWGQEQSPVPNEQ